jgi:hypothetical protein
MTGPVGYLTGPGLRDRLMLRMSAAGMHGHVHYKYVEPADFNAEPTWANVKTAPEYEARHIHVAAYRVNMGGSLDDLHDLVSSEPGCIATRVIREHATLRPQVQAILKRDTRDLETKEPT